MIIEIILLNIPNRKTLEKRLILAGFYRKPNLNNDFKNMILNITSFVNAFTNNLK